MAQQQSIKINGTAYWAHITKPETFNEKEIGYTIMVKPDDNETTEKLNNYLENLFNEEEANLAIKVNRKKPMNLPVKEDANAGECFKAKTNHFYKNKTTGEITPKVLPIFKKDGSVLEQGVLVGNGSKVCIDVTPNVYAMSSVNYGVTLRLNAVQVLDLKEYSATKSAESYGFTTEASEETPEF